jgi:hypothetical protein
MTATINDSYQAIADVNLWFKTRTGDDLMLSDIPSLIPLRWVYFRDNWDFIKQDIIKKVSNYTDPDFLNQQIIDFSKFIEAQRTVLTSTNPFASQKTFNQYYAIFDNTRIDAINLTNEEAALMQNEVARIKAFSKNDFIKNKNTIIDYRDRTTDIYGLTDTQYNTTFNRSPIPQQIVAGITEENYLLTLQHSIKSIDFILSNLFAVDASIDRFALARANANNPDINIGSYRSGTLVKINYGENLESLANRYLGDPNKWLDIAIANGLKPPYIDEVGVSIPLLSNGNGSQINIAEVDSTGVRNIERFSINQPIFLSSSTQVAPDQRTIVNFRQVPISGEIILELDGTADLAKYQISENAAVRVYLPNTINSAFFVMIPSPTPLPDGRVDDVPWFLAKSAEDEKQAKIDIAIDNNGEINFTTDGDINLSYGLENAVQAIKLKIITELGSLRYHPTFGLVNVVGKTNNDIDGVKNLIIQSLTSQIEADSRFDRIETLDVQYLLNSGSNQGVAAIAITMSVRLAGGSRILPISFTVNNL